MLVRDTAPAPMARQGPARANGALGPDEIQRWCPLDAEGRILLRKAFRKLNLSARSYHRILKVARTIADLEGSEGVGARHILEALRYRFLDREA